MNLVYSFYHIETGIFSSRRKSLPEKLSPDDFAKNIPIGHIAIQGSFDQLSQRFDLKLGEVIDYQPPRPSLDHEWDEATKKWRLTTEAQAAIVSDRAARTEIAEPETKQARAMRELLLNPSDVDARSRLAAIDARVAELRPQLNPIAQKV